MKYLGTAGAGVGGAGGQRLLQTDALTSVQGIAAQALARAEFHTRECDEHRPGIHG